VPDLVAMLERKVSKEEAALPKRVLADLLSMTQPELARVDPLEMNLLVAQGIPGLGSLDIPSYQRTMDEWIPPAPTQL